MEEVTSIVGALPSSLALGKISSLERALKKSSPSCE